MKCSIISVFFAAALFAACSGNNQAENKDAKADSVVQSATFAHLRNDIAKYIAEKGVSVGVAVVDFSSKDTLSVNGQHHFAMMSVCKFPQAITLLHLVDSGMLQRNAKVHITSYDLTVPTNSTLKKDHPTEYEIGIKATSAANSSSNTRTYSPRGNINSIIPGVTPRGNAVLPADAKEKGTEEIKKPGDSK